MAAAASSAIRPVSFLLPLPPSGLTDTSRSFPGLLRSLPRLLPPPKRLRSFLYPPRRLSPVVFVSAAQSNLFKGSFLDPRISFSFPIVLLIHPDKNSAFSDLDRFHVQSLRLLEFILKKSTFSVPIWTSVPLIIFHVWLPSVASAKFCFHLKLNGNCSMIAFISTLVIILPCIS